MAQLYQELHPLITLIVSYLMLHFTIKAIERDRKNAEYHENDQGEDYYP